MEIGLIKKIDIDKEMQQAYLDYAMSVIISRALPDARDGLKPVHRRILYAMYDMGLRPNTSYKKSARVVGEVLGKYHPHSDSAVYDAMARMAQDFSMRYTLVDGQGNFGSVDGDPPAAMRYTEAKLASPAMEIMSDIQKETVDYISNFDDSLKEPKVLPAAIPNMLINGATGIAVGMATNIPPHNLNEVADAAIYLLENWSKQEKITVEDLMKFVKGPDFPTGGILIETEANRLSNAYASGRGKLTIQARAHVEDMGRGRQRIIVTELPYTINKSSLIERIAKMVREGKIEGIADLRDESDRQGMRIVIELNKNIDTEKVLSALYKRTPMKHNISLIMLALVNGEPQTLSLKQSLTIYVEHRLEIIKRRSEYDLDNARKREHILEGLRVALNNLDEVINVIRRAKDVETARANLMKKFKLSEIQTNAILDMPLRRLAALERKKIEIEYKEVMKTIKELEGLLSSPKKMRNTVIEELEYVKEKYGDRRRTQIVSSDGERSISDLLTAADLAPDSPAWVVVSTDGKVSKTMDGADPRQWGKNAPKFILSTNSQDTLYLVTESGKAAAIAVHTLPDAQSADQGLEFNKLSPLRGKEPIAAIFNLPPIDEKISKCFVLAVTRDGNVKKSEISELPGPSSQSFTLVKTKPGDAVKEVLITTGKSEILIAASSGQVIRFKESDVRAMGLVAAGVNGMKLKGDDKVIGARTLNNEMEVFLLASDGFAKRVKASNFPVQGRYGQGVAGWKFPAGVQLLGIANDKPNLEVTIHLTKSAAKKVRLDAAPIRTRPSNGKSVLEVKANDQITYVSVPQIQTVAILKGAEKVKSTAKKEVEKSKQIKMPLDEKPKKKK
jgi:DNA gyrase subunit A